MVFGKEKCKTVVVGVGGAGCNVVNQIYKSNSSVDTIAINDATRSPDSVFAGKYLQVSEDLFDDVKDAIAGYDIVFVISGLGGNVGTNMTPTVIEAAQARNKLTFAISIKPFSFEGKKVSVANEGYNHIMDVCPNTMAIENDMILSRMADMTLSDAFKEVNKTIMEQIAALVDEYSDIVMNNKGNKFRLFVENSPLYAFTSA